MRTWTTLHARVCCLCLLGVSLSGCGGVHPSTTIELPYIAPQDCSNKTPADPPPLPKIRTMGEVAGYALEANANRAEANELLHECRAALRKLNDEVAAYLAWRKAHLYSLKEEDPR